MTKNEKALWFLITIVGCAVIWLWLRGSKRGRDIINQISEAFNLPGLSAPVIDLGEGSNYDVDTPDYESASLPDIIPSSSYSGCSMCGEKTVDIVYPAPVTIVETKEVYIPRSAPKKKGLSLGHAWDTKPKRPIYSTTGHFVGYL